MSKAWRSHDWNVYVADIEDEMQGCQCGGVRGVLHPPGEIGQAAKGPRPLQMRMLTVIL